MSEKLTFAKIDVQITEAYPKKQMNSVVNLDATPIIGIQLYSNLSLKDLFGSSRS